MASAVYQCHDFTNASALFRSATGECNAVVLATSNAPLWIWVAGEAERWLGVFDEAIRQAGWSIGDGGISDAPPGVFLVELPRVALHRGDTASWTDGARRFGFSAGLGVRPAEVYVPPPEQWPPSAAPFRATIERDFRDASVKVVVLDHAVVSVPPTR
ncbi:MAG: hypothetical protein AAGE52_20610 [Myxococcota bacterium]